MFSVVASAFSPVPCEPSISSTTLGRHVVLQGRARGTRSRAAWRRSGRPAASPDLRARRARRRRPPSRRRRRRGADHVLGAAPGGGQLAPHDLHGRGRLDRSCRSRSSCVARSSARSVRPMRTRDERRVDQLDDVAAGRLRLRRRLGVGCGRTDRHQARGDRERDGGSEGAHGADSFCRGDGQRRIGRAAFGQARRRPPPSGHPAVALGRPGIRRGSERRSSERRSRLDARAPAADDDRRRCSASSATPGKRSATAGAPRVFMALLRLRLGPVVGEGARGTPLPAVARSGRRSSPRR